MGLKFNTGLLETISGSVERVTFHNEENGFSVLRINVRGQRDLVTVIGNAASISAGEFIECTGVWHNDQRHGLQFKADRLIVLMPSTLDGIEKYLSSGMVRGIGPHFAKKLVKAFGQEVLTIIDEAPARLLELAGIGKKRLECIVTAWSEQKIIRHIMLFLQSHGIGTSRAVRIYKTYGDDAINLIRHNPYRLSTDIRGIGFKTADDLAQRLNIPKDSLLRAQAGIRHVLQELCDQGHCAVLDHKLISASVSLLEISAEIVQNAIATEIAAKNIINDLIANVNCIFPAHLYYAEVNSVKIIKILHQGKLPWGEIDSEAAMSWAERKNTFNLAPSQRSAIAMVLKHKISIITGGPGVGKTTIVKTLVTILQVKKIRIGLCAPTGRAAKRLSETTGMPASTIHRLLEFDPNTYAFKHNQDNRLALDLLIIDESSMLDLLLFYQLLKAVPQHAALLFVGDVSQLPSVGSGAVLTDLINANIIATTRLQEIFRQAANSHIIVNAHRINQGQMPLSPQIKGADFYIVYSENTEEIVNKLIDLVTQRIPRKLHFNPINDIQVLAPMRRGAVGTMSLNVALQQSLNGNASPKVSRFGWTFAAGDKVMQIRNNYNKEVFNGDIGIVLAINLADNIVSVNFDGRQVNYAFHELDELNLAYAISIHKSQGSEFPVIIIPIVMQHYVLLARNLLYTGVTRGKKLVILIGQQKAIAMAIHNNRESVRLTKLAERLREVGLDRAVPSKSPGQSWSQTNKLL